MRRAATLNATQFHYRNRRRISDHRSGNARSPFAHRRGDHRRRARRFLQERVKPEMHQSVVEVGTGVCENIQEAQAGDPTHPRARSSGWRRRTACAWPRRARIRSPTGASRRSIPTSAIAIIVEDMKMVARANLIFGLHVHIGVEDRETAIHLMNARALLPAAHSGALHQFAVLAGHGYRPEVVSLQGVRQVSAHQHSRLLSAAGRVSRAYVNLLVQTNCIDNAKKIWWDIRPHPHFPTLEFRVCDMPMRAGRDHRDRRADSRRPSPSCTSCTSRIRASALPPRADHGKQVARLALRARRQTDRFRQADRSSGARSDGGISGLRRRCGAMNWAAAKRSTTFARFWKRAPARTASCGSFKRQEI